MKKFRFLDEQIIGMIREHECGWLTADVCCKHGVSTTSIGMRPGGEPDLEVQQICVRFWCFGR